MYWGRKFDAERLVFKERREELSPIEQLATGKGSLMVQGEEECLTKLSFENHWRFYTTQYYYIWYSATPEERRRGSFC